MKEELSVKLVDLDYGYTLANGMVRIVPGFCGSPATMAAYAAIEEFWKDKAHFEHAHKCGDTTIEPTRLEMRLRRKGSRKTITAEVSGADDVKPCKIPSCKGPVAKGKFCVFCGRYYRKEEEDDGAV